MKSIVIILVCILSAICGAQTLVTAPFEGKELQFLVRDTAREELMRNAKNVVALSLDKEAREVLDFLKQHTALGMFESGRTILLETATTNTWVAFVPVLPQDTNALLSMKGNRDVSSDFGFFLRETNGIGTIFIRFDYHLSGYAQGILLLHEGNHAKGRFDRGNKTESQEALNADELRVYEFERRIASLVGGKSYDNVVLRGMSKIEQKSIQDKVPFSETVYEFAPYDPELDLAFGRAESEPDRLLRQNEVRVEAYSRLMEKAFNGDDLTRRKKKLILFINRAEPAKK